jgi:hypothetical protein
MLRWRRVCEKRLHNGSGFTAVGGARRPRLRFAARERPAFCRGTTVEDPLRPRLVKTETVFRFAACLSLNLRATKFAVLRTRERRAEAHPDYSNGFGIRGSGTACRSSVRVMPRRRVIAKHNRDLARLASGRREICLVGMTNSHRRRINFFSIDASRPE